MYMHWPATSNASLFHGATQTAFFTSAALLMMGRQMKQCIPCPLAPSQPLEYLEIVATTLL
jgi:hypothetical protein